MADLSKICVTCGDGFVVTENHLALLQKNSPSFGGVRYDFPSPTRCFECRTKQRMAWRNERSLYSRKCALTGKPIISIYAPGSPYVVYDREVWWGDGWDATTTGRDFDFSRPFFEQYAELLRVVPKAAVINIEVENCDYTNFQNESRNCYLCFGSGYMEDSQYCDWTYHAKDTYDCSFCARSELDYGNVDCAATYRCRGCTDCHDASECERCFDCRNCQNCFGCVGLRGKSYHIFNRPYSKEEYAKKVAELRKQEQENKENFPMGNSLAEIQKLKLSHPHRATRMIQCENSTGDDLENCQNCFNCFGVKESQDCANMIDCFKMKDCLDMSRNGACELGYALIGGGYNHQVSFSFLTCFASFSTYTVECMNVKNVFGCVGLQKKEYCILNKQYTKEEYEKMAPRIIEHMKKGGEYGEFFPPSISLFSYNETIAQDFYPMTKEAALQQDFKWRGNDNGGPKPFKLTPQEMAFYKKEGLPTPTLHPNERYRERLARKLPRKLWDRMCTQCGAAIQTPYAPERREKVVCEKCYLKAVY